MRITFVADVRAGTAQDWISYFLKKGHSVAVIASCPFSKSSLPPELRNIDIHLIPLAFTALLRNRSGSTEDHSMRPASQQLLNRVRGGGAASLFTFLRHWLAPVEMRWRIGTLQRLLETLNPEILHAMRLPFEGNFVGMMSQPLCPLVLSTWGNDFILWGRRYPPTRRMSRNALVQASGLHSDCHRDIRMAGEYGFPLDRPTIVIPTGGGVQRGIFHVRDPDSALLTRLNIPPKAPIVFNPRGMRLYVRTDTFFHAIPLVLARRPDAVFLAAAMQGNSAAERWVRTLSVQPAVRLLPALPKSDMARLFQLAKVTLSLGEYDGTPNSLLEAMSCGSLPIAGNDDSIREWITHETNGLLCDSADPHSVAQAIIRGLDDDGFRERAKAMNQEIILRRGDFEQLMPSVEEFYKEVLRGNG